jgi:hypothetical protein
MRAMLGRVVAYAVIATMLFPAWLITIAERHSRN